MGLSRREYAARRGCSDKAVRKALDSRIRAALLPDDTIDPDLADRLWEANTDPTQRRGKEAARAEASMRARAGDVGAEDPVGRGADPADPTRGPGSAPPPASPAGIPVVVGPAPDLQDHINRNRARLSGQTPSGDEGDDPQMLDLAIQERSEKIRRLKLANDEKEGTLILGAPARAHYFAFVRSLSEAWQSWPDSAGPVLAAEFEIDTFRATRFLKDLVREHLQTLSRRDGTEGSA